MINTINWKIINTTNWNTINTTNWNEDQQEALRVITDFRMSSDKRVMTLCGPAGAGKTTLLRSLQMPMAAPTHKAKNLLAKGSMQSAFTVAELLGHAPDTDIANFDPDKPEFVQKYKPKIQTVSSIAIDECSMINDKLTQVLIDKAAEYGTKIIFSGDKFQIPPVNQSSLSATFNYTTAELKKIIRQSNTNPLMLYLLALRADIGYKLLGFEEPKVIEDLSSFYLDYIGSKNLQDFLHNHKGSKFQQLLRFHHIHNDNGGIYILNRDEAIKFHDARMKTPQFRSLAFTNESVRKANKIVYPTDRFQVNDVIMGYRTLTVGEFANSREYVIHDISTGEIENIECEILRISEDSKKTFDIFCPTSSGYSDFVKQDYLEKDAAIRSRNWKKYFSWRDVYCIPRFLNTEKYDVDFGSAMTVHKSQGSTIPNVFINHPDIAKIARYQDYTTYLRMMYVALSRATSNAYILL